MLVYEDYDYVDLQAFKNKRRNKKQKKRPASNGLFLKQIQPKTKNQQATFDAYYQNKHCVLHGVAGTGKTFLSMYLALDEILNQNSKQKIICIRSVVPTRDIGFLPGNEHEKAKVYEAPYMNIVQELMGRGDAYKILKDKKQFEFMTTSFLRGLTFDNAIVIVDEAQNLDTHELDTIITRMGENSRLLIAGDFRQSDLTNNGLLRFISILHHVKNFAFVDFHINDIVRSGLVKEYLLAKEHHV
jgi:phosphate starvation-inducible protein PhoH